MTQVIVLEEVIHYDSESESHIEWQAKLCNESGQREQMATGRTMKDAVANLLPALETEKIDPSTFGEVVSDQVAEDESAE